MDGTIDIDLRHSRAIVREIGERLRAHYVAEQELPTSLAALLDRFRERDAAGGAPVRAPHRIA
ncbi:hypothetical protein [Bradyrhizobium japonicum]|uniref:hypothetical protein n=1 Tax=Bradyrhizobium japonicum TaxID=375 RepID=UPI003B683460